MPISFNRSCRWSKAVLLSTHNLCFGRGIRKLNPNYYNYTLLSWLHMECAFWNFLSIPRALSRTYQSLDATNQLVLLLHIGFLSSCRRYNNSCLNMPRMSLKSHPIVYNWPLQQWLSMWHSPTNKIVHVQSPTTNGGLPIQSVDVMPAVTFAMGIVQIILLKIIEGPMLSIITLMHFV